MATGFIFDPRFCDHDTGPQHPERPDRLRAIHQQLQSTGLLDRLTAIDFAPADLPVIERVHQRVYIDRLRAACASNQPFIDAPDSAICPESYDIALLAVGGALAAVDAVMAGRVDNAFCALRPPGHHAERHLSMGFCLFNNIAIAAEHLRQVHGIERVAIVDFDVHHGNGTQHIFEDRGDVLFISIHEDPRHLYPGTGFAQETGRGDGVGCTINLPMPPRAGDSDYQQAFDQSVLPALDVFKPQVLLVSTGYDAAAADPLADIRVTTAGFRWMTQQLFAVAREQAQGSMICLLEGGYDLTALADGVEATIGALLTGDDDGPN